MTALCDWAGELEVALGLARTFPGGEWDVSLWDASEWEQESDTPLGDWFDVTCDTLDGIDLAAGSNKSDGIITRWEAATARVSLYGRDYDPRTGPFADLLTPGLPVRIRWRPTAPVADPIVALDVEEWRVVFTGTVNDLGYKWDPMAEIAVLECTDRTAELVDVDALEQTAIGAGELASARMHRLADIAQVPTQDRDITGGGVTMQINELSGVVWSQMLDTADTDVALLWIRRDGRLAFRPEGRVAENVPIDATLVPCPEEVVAPPTPAPVATNLLTSNGASAEAALAPWASYANTTVARVNTRARDGAWSVAATAVAAGTMAVYTQNASGAGGRIPVTAGTTITAMWSIFEATVGTAPHLIYFRFFDAAGAALPAAGATVTVLGARPNAWVDHAATFVVPANAVGLALVMQVPGKAAGDVVYFDRAGVFVGTWQPADWRPPGYVPAGTYPVNKLTADQASVEATIGTWVPWSAGVGQTATRSSDRARHGSWSVKAGAGTNGFAQASPGVPLANRIPVTPGLVTVAWSVWDPIVATHQHQLYVQFFDAAGVEVGTAVTLNPPERNPNGWIDHAVTVQAPTGTARLLTLFSVDGLTSGQAVYFDRVMVANGVWTTADWVPPGFVPPAPPGPGIGYVNLYHSDPTILRNWVTIARAKPPTPPNAPEPPKALRIDTASVSRFRPRRYNRTDLLHDNDAWSSTVADVVLADGAWPSDAPTAVSLDSRVHGADPRIVELLLGVEAEYVFSVQSAYDPTVSWRMIAMGWEVTIWKAFVEGTLNVDDVTGWGKAAGWDDPAPPHGWDVDVWALSGQGGGFTPGTPTVLTFGLVATQRVMPGTPLPINLTDPTTGYQANAFRLPTGTYRWAVALTVDRIAPGGGASPTVKVAVVVDGTERGATTVTPTTGATTPVAVAVPSLVIGTPVNWSLIVTSTGVAVDVITPTTVTLTKEA